MTNLTETLLYEWKRKKIPDVIERGINLLEYVKMVPNKIVVVTGFRRVGKTYLTYQLIKKLLKEKNKEQVVYVNFEDERIPLETEFLTNLLPAVKEVFDKDVEYLILDEIQNIPNWSKWLRRVHDSNKDLRIVVTGSSSKLSSNEIPTELRGRCVEIRVLPLSFNEYLEFKNKEINFEVVDKSVEEKAIILRHLRKYLTTGGMPEVVLADRARKSEVLGQYFNTVVSKDVIERFNVKNTEGLKALLRLLLNSTEYTVSKLHNTLKSLGYKVGKNTVQRYISHLKTAYFLHVVYIHNSKVKDRMQYPKKLYFADTGFISLSGKFSEKLGRLCENVVFLELLRRKENVYYWRGNKGKEVDFAIRENLKIKQLIQVCYDPKKYNTKEREIKSLAKALKRYDLKKGLIVTFDYEERLKRNGKIIQFLPLYKWLASKKD